MRPIHQQHIFEAVVRLHAKGLRESNRSASLGMRHEQWQWSVINGCDRSKVAFAEEPNPGVEVSSTPGIFWSRRRMPRPGSTARRNLTQTLPSLPHRSLRNFEPHAIPRQSWRQRVVTRTSAGITFAASLHSLSISDRPIRSDGPIPDTNRIRQRMKRGSESEDC